MTSPKGGGRARHRAGRHSGAGRHRRSDLRSLATEVRNRLGNRPGVVALFSSSDGKVNFVVATTAAARDKGIAAGKLVQSFAPAIAARGGGKPDMAQGGGTNPAGVADAIDRAAGRVDRPADRRMSEKNADRRIGTARIVPVQPIPVAAGDWGWMSALYGLGSRSVIQARCLPRHWLPCPEMSGAAEISTSSPPWSGSMRWWK